MAFIFGQGSPPTFFLTSQEPQDSNRRQRLRWHFHPDTATSPFRERLTRDPTDGTIEVDFLVRFRDGFGSARDFNHEVKAYLRPCGVELSDLLNGTALDTEMEVTVRKREESQGPSDYGTFVSFGSEFSVLEPQDMAHQAPLHGAAGIFPVTRHRRSGRAGGGRAGEAVTNVDTGDAVPWHVTQLKAPSPGRYHLMFLMYEKEGEFTAGDRRIVVLDRIPDHVLVVN